MTADVDNLRTQLAQAQADANDQLRDTTVQQSELDTAVRERIFASADSRLAELVSCPFVS